MGPWVRFRSAVGVLGGGEGGGGGGCARSAKIDWESEIEIDRTPPPSAQPHGVIRTSTGLSSSEAVDWGGFRAQRPIGGGWLGYWRRL
jgi:hypothetical protein